MFGTMRALRPRRLAARTRSVVSARHACNARSMESFVGSAAIR
jgi:hypothetical protein